jgi:hypothetical protein
MKERCWDEIDLKAIPTHEDGRTWRPSAVESREEDAMTDQEGEAGRSRELRQTATGDEREKTRQAMSIRVRPATV